MVSGPLPGPQQLTREVNLEFVEGFSLEQSCIDELGSDQHGRDLVLGCDPFLAFVAALCIKLLDNLFDGTEQLGGEGPLALLSK